MCRGLGKPVWCWLTSFRFTLQHTQISFPILTNSSIQKLATHNIEVCYITMLKHAHQAKMFVLQKPIQSSVFFFWLLKVLVYQAARSAHAYECQNICCHSNLNAYFLKLPSYMPAQFFIFLLYHGTRHDRKRLKTRVVMTSGNAGRQVACRNPERCSTPSLIYISLKCTHAFHTQVRLL